MRLQHLLDDQSWRGPRQRRGAGCGVFDPASAVV